MNLKLHCAAFIGATFFSDVVFASSLKNQYHLTRGISEYEVVVHFDENMTPTEKLGQVAFRMALAPQIENERKGIEQKYGVSYTALFNVSENTPPSLNSITGMMVVQHHAALADLMDICASYEKLASVKYCDLVPKDMSPSATMALSVAQPPAVATQDWTVNQGYLNAAPQGIDAKWAWSIGVTGQGVVAHDAEWAWTQDHEDLDPNKIGIGLAEQKEDYSDHGTAVLGEIMASKNSYGMTGAAYGLDKMWTYSENTGRTQAISAAVQKGNAGEVLILEMQTGGCLGQYTTPDYDQSVWNLVKAATDKGMLVVMAAGNGAENLDNVCYDAYRARGDNGGIIVGAGQAKDRLPASFSTYGTPVDLQGWGDWSVYTLQYGDLFNGGTVQTKYTSGFSGTSSATPIVSGAVILVQSWALQNLKRPLTSVEMRTLLVATGTAQGSSSKHIGPLPNVRAAIEKLILDNNINYSSGTINASSSVISSSVSVSSSLVSSSASTNGTVDCSQIGVWSSGTSYNGSDKVQQSSVAYVANWWTNVEPKTNAGGVGSGKPWTELGACITATSSSSGIISSSVNPSSLVQSSIAQSSQALSSSQMVSSSGSATVIKNMDLQKSHISISQSGFIWENHQNIQWSVLNLEGKILDSGNNALANVVWNKPIPYGLHFLSVQTNTEKQMMPFVIQPK